jgi:hypothetical protein
MGLPAADLQTVHLAGLVHDIGKIGLPVGLLEKEGPLTLEERRVMQGHSEIGERILAKVDDYGSIAEIVRHHHERVDGYGYPDGLDEEEIPLLSRIIAVADAYNAMTSDHRTKPCFSQSPGRPPGGWVIRYERRRSVRRYRNGGRCLPARTDADDFFSNNVEEQPDLVLVAGVA